MKKIVLIILAILLLPILGCSTLNPVAILEKEVIFPRSKQINKSPRLLGLNYEDVYFKTADGIRINAWLIKQPQAKSTIIYFHGNAGNISYRLTLIALFHKMGVNVFIIDYRGYGRSQGSPTEKGLYADAIAAYDYIKSREDLVSNYLIVYGRSLGAAIAIDLATKRNIDALIMDSAFTSIPEMAKKVSSFIPTFLVSTKMYSMKKIRNIKVPKLFIHSPEDEIIPFYMGKRLFDDAPPPKGFLETMGGHNDGFFKSKEKFFNGVGHFLEINGFL